MESSMYVYINIYMTLKHTQLTFMLSCQEVIMSQLVFYTENLQTCLKKVTLKMAHISFQFPPSLNIYSTANTLSFEESHYLTSNKNVGH